MTDLGVERLAAIHSEHTASGAHRSFEVDYPSLGPGRDVLLDAASLSVEEAFANLPACLRTIGHVTRPGLRGVSDRIVVGVV